MKCLVLMGLFMSAFSYSEATYLNGDVSDITSLQEGLLIRLHNGKPSGCTQSSLWMLIPEENKTMVSVALAMHMAGKSNATVYVDVNAPGNYCKVTQYDPHQ